MVEENCYPKDMRTVPGHSSLTRSIAAATLLAALCAPTLAGQACSSTTDDPQPAPQTACTVDDDCHVINDCCAGCYAANQDETVGACNQMCDSAPCDGAYPGLQVSAQCNQGTCEIKTTPSCEDNADCQLIDDCCECSAVYSGEAAGGCKAACDQSACAAEHGDDATVSAVCKLGACQVEVFPAPDTSCDAVADCKLVDDCCAGCFAANSSYEVPACNEACFQSACDAAYGAGSVIDLSCEDSTCGLIVAGQR